VRPWRWYTRAVVDESTGMIITPETLEGEASVVLDELMRQAMGAGMAWQMSSATSYGAA
jgi:ABC-type spermidine/putrescine transport system permease subunit I